MSALDAQIDALDTQLFSFLLRQTNEWDRRALLALQGAAAATCGSFTYLEIGSYQGGSLQAVMRDPRCRSVISIDARTVEAPDDRGWTESYEDNTTEHMRDLLGALPDVDMNKLTTFEAGRDRLSASDLPSRPTYCFVDGEHTYDAVARDARFCAEAVGGEGVIAFHDYGVVGPAIRAFLQERWQEVSLALAFDGPTAPVQGGGVFALELGERGLLRHPAVQRAIGSRWQNAVWRLVNRPRRSVLPLRTAWALMATVDRAVVRRRERLQGRAS
jgi:hypothetical protein